MHDQTSLLAPLALFLVKRGGNGDRVLFRYPYAEPKTGQLELGKYRQYISDDSCSLSLDRIIITLNMISKGLVILLPRPVPYIFSTIFSEFYLGPY